MTIGVMRPQRDFSAEPTLTENALVHGYDATVLMRRREPCACGGWIVAKDATESIRRGVEAHVSSTRHQQWRAWREAT